MKLRNREINIFSMSSLDLFASAMGAFMLLAVIALPFFPNTSDSRKPETDLEKELEQAKKDLAEVREKLSDAEKQKSSEQAVKIKIPDLDLVICLDVTGSMSEQIEGLKREIHDLVSVFDHLAPSAGIGIVAFGDRKWRRPIHIQPIVTTSNINTLKRFINRLTPNMNDPYAERNNDLPEALDRALAEAVAMNWRPASKKRYIIIITDVAAYPHKQASALARARGFSSQQGRHVSTVIVGSSQAEYQTRAFLRQLAGAGQGTFVDAIGGQSMLASLLLAVMNT